jgi:hypothetical protein
MTFPGQENENWVTEQESKQRQFTRHLMCTLLTKALRGLPSVRNITLEPGTIARIDGQYDVWNMAFLT